MYNNKNLLIDLDNKDTRLIVEDIAILFKNAYKKIPELKISEKRKFFNNINIKILNNNTKNIDLTYLKNKKILLNYIFSNINKYPFNQKNNNYYSFKILFYILVILYNNTYLLKEYKDKNIPVIMNFIKDGKYIITIPKYRKYIFNISSFNNATMNII